jgi:fatty-acyl-CoA synthase
MTEMSPLGTICNCAEAPAYAWSRGSTCRRSRTRDFRGSNEDTDDAGRSCRATAKPSVTCSCAARGHASYFKATAARSSTTRCFFDTGDASRPSIRCYMQITDRSKDVIKSGREWISSIEIENARLAIRPAGPVAAGVHRRRASTEWQNARC